MEESSERRRERLRAMREEASLAGSDEGGGSSVANPPDTPGIPLLGDLQQLPKSPSPRFEFYTDPLAAFSGSQRNKKSRNSFGSSFGVAPPGEAPASPLRQPGFTPADSPGTSFSTPSAPFPSFNRTLSSSLSPNFNAPGSFSPSKHGPHHQPSVRGKPQSGMATAPGHFNPNMSSYPKANHMGNFYPSSTPPGGFSSPSSNCQSNPGSCAYGSRSAPYNRNGTFYMSSPASSHFNGGRGSHSAQSPKRHVGGMENSAQSHGSNCSWGSFKQSPGSNSRGTPRKSGGRGFYRSQGSSATPQSFAKRSMLEDPWIDLVPVCIESVAFRLDNCSVSGSRDWLPKSVSKEETSLTTKGLLVTTSGPSLAESLAASFADAVAEEDGA